MGAFAALLPMVGGVLGSLFGGGSKNTMDPATQANIKDLYSQADTSSKTGQADVASGIGTINQGVGGAESAKTDITTGQKGIQSGQADLAQSNNFFKTILSGSREDIQKLLGPEVSTVLAQYDNAAKTASELGPRGGGRTAVMAEAETGKAGAYGKLLGAALPGAATSLASGASAEGTLGSELVSSGAAKGQLSLGEGQLGVGEGQLGTSLNSAGISALGPGQQGETAANELQAQQMSGLGQGLGSIFMNLLKGFGVKGGGGAPAIMSDGSAGYGG